ncbi:cobyric acid synthase [Alkaliphilus transvaalensis]|uniref:cobyric acid synthase n=1 Tax=Alkaliphilus transvaalensis TaxID=114628 RepID=UPI0006891626|nr:cobyric acid synthase [Alkaliphilus transvaalensis]
MGEKRGISTEKTTSKSIMMQGTASSVGKSLLTAALCRVLYQDGYRVVPFKSQNMALNSYITDEGMEMGRAQVMQAEAANIKPHVLMNPILLKPSADTAAQVIIKGKVQGNMTAATYHQYKPQLKEMLREVYRELAEEYDVVVLEGAGSPAEINLMEKDIVNMGMAEIADAPVILVGDIDRGGVFASIYGTIMLLDKYRERIKGVIINKFRGDKTILEPGLKMLEDLTGVPVLGVIPYGDFDIEDEDSVTERFNQKLKGNAKIKIDIIKLPHISNFTDFHILETFPEVQIRYVKGRDQIKNPDMIIIPGSKNTIADLKFIRESGLEKEILTAHKEGSLVFGICGGYQILGKWIKDPQGVESSLQEIRGLGLLDIETIFEGEKVTTQVEGVIDKDRISFIDTQEDFYIKGYEIHMGRTKLGENTKPFVKIVNKLGEATDYFDGAISEDCRVMGTYLHGVFDQLHFTRRLMSYFIEIKGLEPLQEGQLTLEEYKNKEYDKLAKAFRENVDMEKIYQILGV